jgi:hypothetical protein
MNPTTVTNAGRSSVSPDRARGILVAGVAMGVAADLLLLDTLWRVGFTIWVLACLGTAGLMLHDRAPSDRASRRDLLSAFGVAAIGALAFAFTESDELFGFSIVAMLALAALLAWLSARRRALAAVRFRDLPLIMIEAGFSAAFGMLALLFKDGALSRGAAAAGSVRESPTGSPPRNRISASGIIVALPVLLIVAALLVGSDPVFDALLGRVFDVLSERAMEHVVVICFFSWVVAGWLRAYVAPLAPGIAVEDADIRPVEGLRLLLPTLYVLAILLALYLGVQARTMFGGAAYVEATSGLTYAEYARAGVFGLIVVAVIVLASLVGAHWLVNRADSGEVTRFRRAGWVLIALVAVLIVSAAQRMALYVHFYGLTTMRVYAIAATLLVAACFVTGALTLMRLRGERFAIAVLASCGAALILLHVVNPERLVVQANGARALSGETFDVEYHGTLSADAAPALLDVAATLPHGECVKLVHTMRETWTKRVARDERPWQRWSLSFARAAQRLDQPIEVLVARTCRSQPVR